MNAIVKGVTLVMIFMITNVFSQDFQGIATYKTKRKVDFKMDSTAVDVGMQAQIQEMLAKQFEKEFELVFDKETSVYKEVEKLNAPQPAGVRVMMIGGGSGSNVLFKNIKEKRYANQNELMGKIFLIKDELNKQEWKLTDEKKHIGEYTCYKATYTSEVRAINSISINGEDSKEQSDEMREVTITAWYTPEIPVSNGPSTYWGLPGLILEANDGSETIVCSKIVLNPKNKVNIAEPNKGKEVTQEKFQTIMEKKMQEMQDRYQGRRDDGNTFKMTIGG